MASKKAKRGKKREMVVTSETLGAEPEPLKQVDKDGAKRRQRKVEKAAEKAAAGPPLEKGPWVIRRPPGTALLAELAPKQAEAHEEIRVLQRAIEDSAQRHKELRNKKEKEIAGIEERLDELSREVRFGTTATVTCWRRREGDEWVFYRDKDGTDELWREPAFDGVQQRLCGKEVAKPAYRIYDAVKDGTVDELLARAKGFVAPPSELSEVVERELAPWPWGDPSWHPFVLARQLELQTLLDAADPSFATEPRAESKRERVAFDRGATVSLCQRYSLIRDGGLWQPCYGPASHHEGALPGTAPCVNKTQAVRECQRHLDTRHRWPAEWYGVTKIEARGQYQLTQLGSGLVLAIHVGSLDEETTELGEHPDEELAQQACQADADRRAEG